MKITLKLALLAMLLPMAAMAQTVPYIITGSDGHFTAKKGVVQVGKTGPIQEAIDSIKTNAKLADIEIQFGSSAADTLKVPGAINFGAGWGKVTLSGNITNSNILFSEDFEGVSHGLTVANGTQVNQWHVDTVIVSSPINDTTKAIRISNNGGEKNAYTLTSPSIVHAYRDISFPASSGAFVLKFDYKGNVDNPYDKLTVHLVETSVTPVAGSVVAVDSIYRLPSGSGSWVTTNDIVIPASNSLTTKRLVFTWQNNNVGGNNPPIAIDNIIVGTQTSGAIISLSEGANVESKANIISDLSYAISHDGYGTLKISGGEVSTTEGMAIANFNTGVVSVSGGKVSATKGYAIYNGFNGAISISGGIVSATKGLAIYNDGNGSIGISGGTVSTETGYAIYNEYESAISISGGIVSATKGDAINSRDGDITISGGTITSANVSQTILSYGKVTIIGGTIENTSTGVSRNAVEADSTVLGGNPTINGNIKGNYNSISVITNTSVGTTLFAPEAGKVYTLAFDSDNLGATAVKNGKNFANNFDLFSSAYMLDVQGSDLVTATMGFIATENEASEELYYIITKRAGGSSIQHIVDSLGTEAASEPFTVQFGDNTNTLNIGAGVTLNNAAWGKVTLLGKITAAAGTAITVGGATKVESKLNIIASSIRNIGSDTLTISSGTISTTTGYAVENSGITIISGGTISATTGVDVAVRNFGSGKIIISGGTISATTGIAVRNSSTDTITVSGTANITSARTGISGTFYVSSGVAKIIGGTIANTYTEATDSGIKKGNAIYSDGFVVVLGGNPTITGNIAGLSSESLEVGADFAPTAGKVYTLGFGTYETTPPVVAVLDGKDFLANFDLVDDTYGLAADTSTINPTDNLVIWLKKGFKYELAGGVYKVTSENFGSELSLVMDSIRVNAAGTPVAIQFGSGTDTLDIGTNNYTFSASSATNPWSEITLSGKIKSTTTSSVIIVSPGADTINVTSGLDIIKTATGGAITYNNAGTLNIASGTILATSGTVTNGGTGTLNIAGGVSILATSTTAVSNSGTGVVNIAGGTIYATGSTVNNGSILGAGTVNIADGAISATTGYAVNNTNSGNVNIGGGTFTSTTGNYVVYNGSSGTLEIANGTITATTGRAVGNVGFGALNIGGGTISATTGTAVYSVSGVLNIGGGTISATTGYAVYSGGSGKVSISGNPNITSANTTGTIYLSSSAPLEISGGTITNTATGANGNAIYNPGSGTVEISGGTISATATNGYAVRGGSGKLTISGGTISATTGSAVYGLGETVISGTASVTSANASEDGTVYIAGYPLKIIGASIANTASLGTAVSSNGTTRLGGDPSITGLIRASVGNFGIITADSVAANIFAPAAGKVYNLAFSSSSSGDIVVKDGKDFEANFAIPGSGLIVKVNDLAIVPMAFAFAKVAGTGNFAHAGTYAISEAVNGLGIQAVVDSIRNEANGLPIELQFGNGADTLNIGSSMINLQNGSKLVNSQLVSATWGAITLSGKITNTTASTSAININGNLIVESKIDIVKTTGGAISNIGNLLISGGTISTTGNSVVNAGNGKLTISGGAIATTAGYAVSRDGSSEITISGGAISATTGTAVRNNTGYGKITINEGTISTTTGYAVHNSDSWGYYDIIINGGTISATTGSAIYNQYSTTTINNGAISVTGVNGYAVYNDGTVKINGGTISATDTTNYAVYNTNSIEINGGTISVTDTLSYAVYNNGTISISRTANIASASKRANSGTVHLVGGTATIAGGTIRNTAEEGVAVYREDGNIDLKGNPNITGVIKNLASSSLRVDNFAPASGKVYTLDFEKYYDRGDSIRAVLNGKNNIDNFALANTGFGLYRSGQNLFIAPYAEACEADGGTYNETTGVCTTKNQLCIVQGNLLGADGVCRTTVEVARAACLAAGTIYDEESGTCKTALEIAESVCGTETGKKWQNGKCVSPIRILGLSNSQIAVKASKGAITLENLPKNAKVEIFNLNGKQIVGAYGIRPTTTANATIPMQPGMYIVKINKETFRIAVK